MFFGEQNFGESNAGCGRRGLWKSKRPYDQGMAFPLKVCVICGEEFELKPDKPGFANRCPSCSEPEEDEGTKETDLFENDPDAQEARRRVMRDMLYRNES